MSIALRPYQSDLIDRTRRLMAQGCHSILITSPTGSGKTLLTAHMLHTAASRGMGSWFVVHRRELIKQSTNAFALEGLKHGIIGAGFYEDRRHTVQLASVQTLIRRFKRFRPPRLIVWDEAHHLASESWGKTFAAFPQCFHIGLTATPERLDGRGLGRYFQAMVAGPTVEWLIANNYLSPYRLYAPTKVELKGIHTRMGDYEIHELAALLDQPSITGDVISHYQRLAPGKRAIVFCVSIQHSRHVVEQFVSQGIRAAHVDGDTSSEERDAAIERFKEGSVQVLSNVEIFGEGFDVPAVEAAILLRPTQSLGYYLQQVGRALRPSEGKTQALILDHVGNYERHGLPDDPHQWSLAGRDERNGKKGRPGISVKVCPKCFAAQQSGMAACKFCGYVFEAKPREVEQHEGELGEIDTKAWHASRREQGQVHSLEELTRLGIQRGYRYPRRWAYYVFKARQAKRLERVA